MRRACVIPLFHVKAPVRWVDACVGDFASPADPLTSLTHRALDDATSLTRFCRGLIDENLRGTFRVNTIDETVLLRRTTTSFSRVTTRTARHMPERPLLIALQRLAMHALPHSLAHRYWSCLCIRPLTREAFTTIQRPHDLRGWVFGRGRDGNYKNSSR
ncbi:hypothetical protein LAZ67_2001793 [Cordylochernes scorpioides]|uniref:Uncharacterized protein n=1 Tax=Cordylochernes scorpioides TaxID=51811 RepID=A0ABY6K1J1_9ARAC|nr:hypothetical protein LAZ67_2001793 [Cordylochernes scorpioides]